MPLRPVFYVARATLSLAAAQAMLPESPITRASVTAHGFHFSGPVAPPFPSRRLRRAEILLASFELELISASALMPLSLYPRNVDCA